MDKGKRDELNPAVLAYVGDAVFSLYVRARITGVSDAKSGELTRRANRFVRASAQSLMLESIADKLTAQESDVVRRARNCHTASKAKNASLSDYRRATALEALLGWLYIGGENDRLDEIQNLCYEVIDK